MPAFANNVPSTMNLPPLSLLLIASAPLLYLVGCHASIGKPWSRIADAETIRNNEQQRWGVQSEDWSRLLGVDAEWPNYGRNEVTVKVINSMCKPEYAQYYDAALSEWNQSTALYIEKYTWDGGECDSRLRSFAGYINVVNGRWPGEPWTGSATWSFTAVNGERRINSVLVLMNDYYLWNPWLRTSSEAHRKQSMCHELGHALGLVHPDENHLNRNTGSCMDYSAHPQGGRRNGLDFGPHNMQPSVKDYQDLHDAYIGNSLTSTNGTNATVFEISSDHRMRSSAHLENSIDDQLKMKIVGELKLNETGELISEIRSNGIFEKTYKRHDEESGLITVTVSTGLVNWDDRS